MENILEKTARIGTTGNRILDEEFETVNTTPESLELIKLIDKSVKKGADYFIMEVSFACFRNRTCRHVKILISAIIYKFNPRSFRFS